MKKNIRDYDLNNKRVLIRCDFNVPMKNGEITDDNRIVTSLPTIKYALDNNAKIILFSHLGRVKEEADLAKNDLRPVATRLSELLGKEVKFVPVTRGEELETTVANMNNGDIVLVQNTRYEDLDGKKESKNDEELAKYWASLGDLFINDAFGTLHRAHASNSGLASNLPSGVGLLVEKELKELSRLDNPEKPFVLILGGSKVADKIGVIENLVTKADYILIGGGMAFTFLKAKGINTAKSVIDEENLEFAKKMIDMYPDKIILPIDVNAFEEFNNDANNRYVAITELNENEMGLDIGPNTIEKFTEILKDAKIVFWNGPLGVYEFEKCTTGSKKILETLVNYGVTTILGGGDIVAAAGDLGYKEKVTHASTGGGATLEYMEGKELPGLSCIPESN
ncbi:MAG: phosphoglycerate kinase [Bacilli bacterium]|nr:phosphoglycerate kinase [Bacilli bacterium]